jgi:hypothetical protein
VVVRAFLNWAHQKHYLDQQPMARMKPPHVYKPRERVLSDAELKAVWKACGDDTHGTIVKLLMLTGQRVGEITKLSHDMVEGDRITLPSWLARSLRKHTLRIPVGLMQGDQATALLSQLRVIDTRRLAEKVDFLDAAVFGTLRKAARTLF